MSALMTNQRLRTWLSRSWRVLTALAAALVSTSTQGAPDVAPRPPMGWNSWDAYGFTITEAQFKANVSLLARWKRLGWSYAVIDEGWYMGDPAGVDAATRRYQFDGFGRLEPVVSRFPSAADGHGLRALATWTHSKGLKFGIHIVRGIPKAAADANQPIAGSSFHARDAANRADLCPWDQGNYGVADNAAGQAYYNSLVREYADWGVDFLKVDCIADHPYRPAEIRQIGEAIRKAGRPMVLSLSPGPAQLENRAEMAHYAQMWRIADDFWDRWTFPHPDPKTTFPNGVRNGFDNLARWSAYAGPNQWPDADMLPFGSLRPHPGWGEPRISQLTPAEVRTNWVLWSIARSPLILGGNLTELRPSIAALLTNTSVIALNQEDREGRSVENLPASLDEARIWISSLRGRHVDTVAVFNLSEHPMQINLDWAQLGLDRRNVAPCDLLTGRRIQRSAQLATRVASHDVSLLRISRDLRATTASACPG